MNTSASNAILPTARENLLAAPHLATDAALTAALTANFPSGVWRDHFAAGGTADGPEFFTTLTGTCVANGYVNDGGQCRNNASGNAFLGVLPNGVYNVKLFGARGDGATDDTAAIQAAVNAASVVSLNSLRGVVWSPGGAYCVATAGGVTTTGTRLRLTGNQASLWKVCGGANTTVLTLNGFEDVVDHLQFQGLNSTAVTQSTLVLGSACTECQVGDNVFVQYGYRGIDDAAVDSVIGKNVKVFETYGPALVRVTSASFLRRVKLDENYPYAAPAAGSATLNAWAASTVYAAGALVTIGAGAWVLQATVGGTSGTVAPAVPLYETNVADGTVTWRLAAPNPFYALQIETGAAPVFVESTDTTGVFTAGVALTNATGGTGPQLVTLRDGNYGQNLSSGVLASAGQGLFIEGGSATNCVLTGCKGVNIASTFGDKVHIGAGFIAYQNPYDIYLGATSGAVINGASLHGASTACIDAAPGVQKFTIVGNDLSTIATWGTCAVGVNVEAGAGDYYKIIGNVTQGATTGVSDGGTGIHKTLLGND